MKLGSRDETGNNRVEIENLKHWWTIEKSKETTGKNWEFWDKNNKLGKNRVHKNFR